MRWRPISQPSDSGSNETGWSKVVKRTQRPLDLFTWWRRGHAFDTGSGLKPVKSSRTEDQEKDRTGRAVHCARCDTLITYSSQAFFYNGEHHFRRTNPHGLTFDLALYQQAACRVRGEPTTEWSWFGGYAWQLAMCPACGAHLGWAFSGTDKSGFFGLIVTRLRIDE